MTGRGAPQPHSRHFARLGPRCDRALNPVKTLTKRIMFCQEAGLVALMARLVAGDNLLLHMGGHGVIMAERHRVGTLSAGGTF